MLQYENCFKCKKVIGCYFNNQLTKCEDSSNYQEAEEQELKEITSLLIKELKLKTRLLNIYNDGIEAVGNKVQTELQMMNKSVNP